MSETNRLLHYHRRRCKSRHARQHRNGWVGYFKNQGRLVRRRLEHRASRVMHNARARVKRADAKRITS